MKTNKQLTVMAIVAIVTLAFTACKDDPPLCTCNPKAHLGIDETCKCGGSDCNSCTLQVYGIVEEKDFYDNPTGTLIPIYRSGTVIDILGAVEKVKEAYGMISPGNKNRFKGKIKEIRVIPGLDRSWSEDDNGMYTIELGEERPAIQMSVYIENQVGTTPPPSP